MGTLGCRDLTRSADPDASRRVVSRPQRHGYPDGMTGDGTNRYSFTTTWLKCVLPPLALVGAFAFFAVTGLPTGPGPAFDPGMQAVFLTVGGVAFLGYGWVVLRKLVRSASVDGRHLRAATL